MKPSLESEDKNLQSENKQLKDCIFNRIESERVCPKSKLYFKGRECLIWTLWLLSVVLGAFAVAVTVFVFTYQHYALYEATHDNLFTYLADTLPYLWLIVFGLMGYIAFYNLHQTNRGYRHSLWVLMLSSVFLSLVGGLTLQIFSLGHAIDNMMDRHMPVYQSQNKQEQRVWQSPPEGRLVGRQVLTTLSPTTTVIFEDMSGTRWQMDVSELSDGDIETLSSGETVKLLGKSFTEGYFKFHACLALLWIPDKNTVVKEKSEDRKVFIEKLSDFAKRSSDKEGSTPSYKSSSTKITDEKSVCSKILPIDKLFPSIANSN